MSVVVVYGPEFRVTNLITLFSYLRVSLVSGGVGWGESAATVPGYLSRVPVLPYLLFGDLATRAVTVVQLLGLGIWSR